MKKIAVLIIFGLLTATCFNGKSSNSTNNESTKQIDSLTIALQKYQDKNILPGFVVSIFTKDSILYQKGFGHSNVPNKLPYNEENVQMIASITKTLIGVSLMKLIEEGKLKLDEPINDILPFEVINPKFPEIPITLKHLATHTSSIGGSKNSDKGYRFKTPLKENEFPEVWQPLLEKYNKTEEISMAKFLELKLNKEGKWYEASVFNHSQPGSEYEYSNLGATLLAHIIEISTDKNFNDFTTEYILQPLKLSASTWNIDEVEEKSHISYYNEIYNEIPKYYIITYPDGGLYSSVSDLTKYLQEMMKGYNGESNLLSKESFREMMSQQYDKEELTEGLCWDLSIEGLIGHAGNDFGTSTLMYFSPESGIGRILFTNISTENEDQEETFYGIYNLLFKYDLSNNASR